MRARHHLGRLRRKACEVLGLSQPKSDRTELFVGQVDPDHMAACAETHLAKLFYSHKGRLVDKWDHYFPIYERHLARYVAKRVRLLEIGVFHGGSLQLWRKFFGPEAIIFGIDIDPRCASLDGPDACVRIGSQVDSRFLRSVVREMGGLDVVIDDGSHFASHQWTSFETLFPLVDANGVYITEDLHACYWPAYEGGLRRHGTFIEEMKGLVDDIHAWYSEAEQHLTDAHKTIGGIHFYDSVVVVEKKPKEKPFRVKIGTPSF
jgi:hypothetical protein